MASSEQNLDINCAVHLKLSNVFMLCSVLIMSVTRVM